MIEVTGYSDDIVSIKGDLNEEYGCYDAEEVYIAFSDGTLITARYGSDGNWRIVVDDQALSTTVWRTPFGETDGYTDIVTVDADSEIRWAVFSKVICRR